ncbi:MAG: DUF1549 domain-containing protein, partial [Verrucomicrobiota bacterium]
MKKILSLVFLSGWSMAMAVDEPVKDKKATRRARKAAKIEKKEPVEVPIKPMSEIRNAPRVEPDIRLRLNRDAVKAAAAEVDRLVAPVQAKAGVKPNPRAKDSTFVRRVYLDLTGRIPSAREALLFLRDTRPDKRERLIDALLVSPGYRSHQFNWMADMFRVKSGIKRWNYANYQRWLKDQIEANRPWSEVVYDLMTAEGSLATSGPSGYLLRDPGMPLDNLSNTLSVFLGANVACAQCHDHPLAEWTQREFYEMASFFGGTYVSALDPRKVGKRLMNKQISKQEIMSVVAPNMAQVRNLGEQRLTYPDDYAYDDVKPGAPVEPVLIAWHADDRKLDIYDLKSADAVRLREQFAAWLTAPENPRFAISVANRLWQRAFGIAVQEPIENL